MSALFLEPDRPFLFLTSPLAPHWEVAKYFLWWGLKWNSFLGLLMPLWVLNFLPQPLQTNTWPLCFQIMCWFGVCKDLKAFSHTLQGWTLFICFTLRSWVHEVFSRFRMFSPGLGDNYAVKCGSGIFPHTKYMSRCVENSQNHTLLLSISPIPGRSFKKQGKLWDKVFLAFQTFSPGLEKNEGTKCGSENFQRTVTYILCVEKCQNHILMHGCLPIPGRPFQNVRKLHGLRISEWNIYRRINDWCQIGILLGVPKYFENKIDIKKIGNEILVRFERYLSKSNKWEYCNNTWDLENTVLVFFFLLFSSSSSLESRDYIDRQFKTC